MRRVSVQLCTSYIVFVGLTNQSVLSKNMLSKSLMLAFYFELFFNFFYLFHTRHRLKTPFEILNSGIQRETTKHMSWQLLHNSAENLQLATKLGWSVENFTNLQEFLDTVHLFIQPGNFRTLELELETRTSS